MFDQVKYNVNVTGVIVMLLASLIIFPVVDVDSLNRNEEIITGLLVLLFADSLKLEVSGTDPILKWVVIALVPYGLFLIFAAFYQLLTV